MKDIKQIQEEVDRYKHLWETDSVQSKEIIAELKWEIKKLKEKFLAGQAIQETPATCRLEHTSKSNSKPQQNKIAWKTKPFFGLKPVTREKVIALKDKYGNIYN